MVRSMAFRFTRYRHNFVVMHVKTPQKRKRFAQNSTLSKPWGKKKINLSERAVLIPQQTLGPEGKL